MATKTRNRAKPSYQTDTGNRLSSANTVTRTRSFTSTRTFVATGTSGRSTRALLQAESIWRRVRAWFWLAVRTVRAGVTPAGWLGLGVAVLGLIAGLTWGWTEWLVAGLAAAIVLLVALPFLIGSANYGVAFDIRHARVRVGQAASLGVEVTNNSTRVALPAHLDVPLGEGLAEVPLPLMAAGRTVTQDINIPTQKRGVIPVGPVTFVRTDPVGMLRREARWPLRTEVFVHPRTTAIPSSSIGMVRDLDGTPTRQLVDSDVSFHAIREYQPGDAQRHVHWKSTAKTGKLMVRQYEASMRSRLAVVLSCARDEFLDDDEYELAVSVAASVTSQAIRDGRDVTAIVGAPLPELVRARVRAIDTLPVATPTTYLDSTCRLKMLGRTMPLEEVCRMSAEQCAHLSLAVMVCGSTVGINRVRRAALMFPADAQVLAVIVDEHAHPGMRQLGNLSVLTIGVLEDLAGLLVRAGTS